MRRLIVLPIVALLLLLTAAPVSARVTSWHRVNPAQDPPEHERLVCAGHVFVACVYRKAHTPGYSWDRTRGIFRGHRVPLASWDCPTFAGDVCDHVQRVVSGRMRYRSAPHTTYVWQEDLIFTDGDGVAPLYMWIKAPPGPDGDTQFVCPWEATFAAAQASFPDYCMTS